jgi:hypothetical protein
LSVFDDDQKDIYETVKQQSFFVKRGESSALKLRYPVQGLVLFPERLPTQLRVEWEPTTSGNYQIFMWQSGQPGSPVGSISGASHFYVNLPSYGGYFLMVKDHDGRKSPVVSFELPVPSSLWSDEVSVLTLKHPASAAEYHVGDRADVMFDWSASGRGRRYTLSIESIDVPSKKIAVEMPPVSVRLEPGVYRWSVSADSTALPRVEPLESERRSLVVSTDRMGIAGAFGQAVENLPKQTHPTVSMFFE